ncbi:PLP-dependent aminotransferase family protein [Paenibacillus aceti]|uniref:HTH-type transcriptional regulator YisV n=1 Tax=Paenibacillus aceti TaxID=1820010 RepID=A0ABQ1VZR4_9BACL|nr:PLP-dependent aminotransferase family protein [Paenibacillus aceti]GGG07515.1 putative HTH-type transcriptional regulator YisV [Paenibacillus aceti]
MKWLPNRHSHLTIHQQIIDWIKQRIQSGEWPIHTKLPPQRKMAEAMGVNRSTIVNAIEELVADGILSARVGDGTYVSNNSWNVLVKSNHPDWEKHISSSIYEPNFQTIQLINEYEQREDIIRLGTGELSPELLPTAALQRSLQDISLTARDIGYSEPKGSRPLRHALSRYAIQRGIHVTPDSIMIVSGALQALQLISLGLLEPGSTVFQESPSYLNSVRPFQSAGMRIISLERGERDNHWLEQIRAMKGKKQSLFYTVPTLHNPTGSIMSLEERRELLQIGAAQQIPIIEDDVYHELAFGEIPPALKSLDTSGQVLYIGSMSKTLSPGLRIGWVIAPEPVIDRLADIKMQTDYGSSAFSQQIARHWLESGLYEQHIVQLRGQLKQRADFVTGILRSRFSRIATWHEPTGGFYIWLRLHEPLVNKALFLKLMKQKVLINPGYIYDAKDFHHIRLSYAYASFEQLETGLNLLYGAIVEGT